MVPGVENFLNWMRYYFLCACLPLLVAVALDEVIAARVAGSAENDEGHAEAIAHNFCIGKHLQTPQTASVGTPVESFSTLVESSSSLWCL